MSRIKASLIIIWCFSLNLRADPLVVDNYEWAETPRLIKLSSNYSTTGASCGKEFELCIGPANRKSNITEGASQVMIKCFIPKNRFECPTTISASNQCVGFDEDELADAGAIPACISGGGTDNRFFKCRCESRSFSHIPATERFYAQTFADCTRENNRRRTASQARQREAAELAARRAACEGSAPAGTWSNNMCDCGSNRTVGSDGSCSAGSEAIAAAGEVVEDLYYDAERQLCNYINSCEAVDSGDEGSL